jgi:hypothetical protein
MARRTLKSALRAAALSATACCSKIRDFRKKLISQTKSALREVARFRASVAGVFARGHMSSRKECGSLARFKRSLDCHAEPADVRVKGSGLLHVAPVTGMCNDLKVGARDGVAKLLADRDGAPFVGLAPQEQRW